MMMLGSMQAAWYDPSLEAFLFNTGLACLSVVLSLLYSTILLVETNIIITMGKQRMFQPISSLLQDDIWDL